MKNHVLLVDDEELPLVIQAQILENEGLSISTARSVDEALGMIRRHRPSLIVSDLNMPGKSGFDLLREVRTMDAGLPVVILTGQADAKKVLAAYDDGASDFLLKPVDPHELVCVAHRLLNRPRTGCEKRKTVGENETGSSNAPFLCETIIRADAKTTSPKDVQPVVSRGADTVIVSVIQPKSPKHGILAYPGSCPVMLGLGAKIDDCARDSRPILIHGDVGTERLQLAREIHLASRNERPFMSIDCTRQSKGMTQRRVFGDSAESARDYGMVEKASGGTLFMDEVSCTNDVTQFRLEECISDKFIRRPGTDEIVTVDTRLIFSSKLDMAKTGTLRPSLLRLLVTTLHIPPLRDRLQDVLPIAECLARTCANSQGFEFAGFRPEAADRLVAYSWPGNTEELADVIGRAIGMARDHQVTPGQILFIPFKPPVAGSQKVVEVADSWHATHRELEALTKLI